jgi:Mn-dependent DtxR family transcriptional regulator
MMKVRDLVKSHPEILKSDFDIDGLEREAEKAEKAKNNKAADAFRAVIGFITDSPGKFIKPTYIDNLKHSINSYDRDTVLSHVKKNAKELLGF